MWYTPSIKPTEDIWKTQYQMFMGDCFIDSVATFNDTIHKNSLSLLNYIKRLVTKLLNNTADLGQLLCNVIYFYYFQVLLLLLLLHLILNVIYYYYISFYYYCYYRVPTTISLEDSEMTICESNFYNYSVSVRIDWNSVRRK